MSAETCGGRVMGYYQPPGGPNYFLRDDRDANLCDYERYSLFREGPHYGRVVILNMTLNEAFEAVPEMIQDDQQALNGSRQ